MQKMEKKKKITVRKQRYKRVKLQNQEKLGPGLQDQHLRMRNPVIRVRARVELQAKLRTFSPIATAHRYSARKFTCHVMHRARVLSTKMNNDRADGHCYSFAWIYRSWRFSDPYFSFEKQILFTIISTLSKNQQKINMGS